ncbi:MAG: polysaccharide biosynthesis protein [Clostridia bacterium]|nr:polysaccharide biosynthesis protein [Clostridia bacterium]
MSNGFSKNLGTPEERKSFFILSLRRLLLVLIDAVSVNLAFAGICAMNYPWDEFVTQIVPALIGRSLYTALVFVCTYMFFGLYNSLWEYAGLHELVRCAGASAVATFITIGIDSMADRLAFLDAQVLRVSVYFTAVLLITAVVGSVRLIYRVLRRVSKARADSLLLRNRKNKRVMIIGAGDMGLLILKEYEAKSFANGKPVVFVDDSPMKRGRHVEGVPIKGTCEDIPELAKKFRINEIIYAIPSASPQRRSEILRLAMETGCTLKTSLSIQEITEKNANETTVRDVEITDLLARPEVTLNTEICSYLKGQTVVVTGGGGSIGSEICTQVARYSPEKVIIFDNYENNAFVLKNKLDRKYKGKVQFFIRIGSVQDPARLKEVFEEFKPSVVFHAAAHKHVPLMEDSPCEAVKNNIFGTYNTAQAAIDSKVKKFVILSTDKAVNPTNVMGATKRVTELIIQYFERKNTGTHFAAVRFGNVLGSNGSVIPIFKEQIALGGPVTVTHKDITRYFMTIPEAAQLVVQAGGIAKGGEIFVLDMGEPVSITSLAEKLITLSGYKPYEDIKIEFTGLRPGEKLYEELTLSEEETQMQLTCNDKIFVLPPVDFSSEQLEAGLENLKKVDRLNVRETLLSLVPNFKSEE